METDRRTRNTAKEETITIAISLSAYMHFVSADPIDDDIAFPLHTSNKNTFLQIN